MPFEDADQNRLFQKILYADPFYPGFLSIPAIDLLEKMCSKDPARRITLAMIKGHPWFSQSDYQALVDRSGSERGSEGMVDEEIIEAINALGLDCSDLRRALIEGENTDVTALYRIYERLRLTQRVEEQMLQFHQVRYGTELLAPMLRAALPSTENIGSGRVRQLGRASSPIGTVRRASHAPTVTAPLDV
jgi:hypothetical protein